MSDGMTHLSAACRTLAARCVDGITANEETLRHRVENSIGLVTALSPSLGYVASTAIAQEALRSGRTVLELVLSRRASSSAANSNDCSALRIWPICVR